MALQQLPLSRRCGDDFLADVWRGLSRPEKQIPSKYLYDEQGSALFEQICELDEYYPTRTEVDIMHRSASEMAQAIGPEALVIELGSGSARKSQVLLSALQSPAAYLPVDVSPAALDQTALETTRAFPALDVLPLMADFTQYCELPPAYRTLSRRLVYFPGSTIGNFHPPDVRRLLWHIRGIAGPSGKLLIGIDLQKSPATIEAAYNDLQGVTAAFNLNILQRANRELSADFDLDGFQHQAVYDLHRCRVELGLVSRSTQSVRVGSRRFAIAQHELIRSEYSYKYTITGFARLAASAGWRLKSVWTDPRHWFAVLLMTQNWRRSWNE